MKSAVIYARFSSDRQSELSIEAQVRACREYAQGKGYTIEEIYKDEAISGKTTNRAAYQRMLRDAKKGKFQTILIHKYDRISRNLGDQVNLNAKLKSLDIELIATAQDYGSSKEGKLMTGIQWILGEYYIDNLSEEVKKGHKEIAYKGLHNGGCAPFGYDIVDQKYVVNPVEASYVQKIYYCAINCTGYKELLKEMNEAGIVGKRGKPLRYSSIYEILRNEKYTGTYVYSSDEEKDRKLRREKPNAIRVDGALPTIIPRDVWERVQEIMDEKKRTKRESDYLCSGLVYCECGAKMHAQVSANKGHTYHYYVCSNHCGAKAVKVETVDKMVQMYLDELTKPEIRETITNALKDSARDKQKYLDDFMAMKQEKINAKQAEINNLTSNLATASLPETVVKIVAEKIKACQEELDHIMKVKPVMDYTIDTVGGWLDAMLSKEPDELPRFIIDRIEIKNNSATIISSLSELLDELGCGGSQCSDPTTLLQKIPIQYLYKVYYI